MKIPILGQIADFVGNIFKKWADAKLAEAEHRAEIAKIKAKASAEVEVSQAQADIKWDLIQARASRFSWKDEFWTIVLACPVILAFIPGGEQYVEEGFRVLREDVPQWYLYALGAAVGAAFGTRKIASLMANAKMKGFNPQGLY